MEKSEPLTKQAAWERLRKVLNKLLDAHICGTEGDKFKAARGAVKALKELPESIDELN